MKLFITLVLLGMAQAETDKVCIGVSTGAATGTVDSLSRKNVPVVGHIELAANSTNGKFCRKDGGAPRSQLDSTGVCSNAEVIMMANCGGTVPLGSYHIKKPFQMRRCFPLTEDSVGRFDRMTDVVMGYSQVTQTPVMTSVAGDWGSYTAGTSSSCLVGGVNSFFDSVHWLVPVTKGAVSPANSKTLTNTNCEKMVLIWGMFQADQASTMNNIYGVFEDSITASTSETTQILESRLGPFTTPTSGNPTVNQVSRMELRYSVIGKGESITFTYGQGFIAPKTAWCLNNKIPVLPVSGLAIDLGCDTKCVTDQGSMEKKTPFQTVTKIYHGDCPVYSPIPLRLANGTESKMVIKPRGLFGAIAGFLEGGWEGMVNGWYGYHSQSEQGQGVAADYKSTQKAVDKIVQSMNSLTNFVNKNFNQTYTAIQAIEKEIGEVDDKVNDLRADVFAFQLKQMVLMENERILDSHDLHLQELKMETSKMLGPSAKDLGDGCFEVQHKCDQECLNALKDRTYDDKKFIPQALVDEIYLGKVQLKINEKGWQDPLLIVDSCLILGMFITGLLAFIKWGMSNGSIRCTACI